MSLVSAASELIRLCWRAGLDEGQRALLETVLGASDPRAVLTRHVSHEPTGVAAIARVHSALESRARPGRATPQPYDSLAFSLVEAALNELNVIQPHVSAGRLDSSVAVLNTIKAGGKAGLTSAADCRTKAVLVEGIRADVRAAVVDGFAEAWRSHMPEKTGQRLALEMAALCVMEGRQHYFLSAEVRTALSRGSLDADQMLKVLLPAERDIRVAVIVEGTSRLESLGGLMDPACAAMGVSPGEPTAGWGRGTSDLEGLADLAAKAADTRREWSRDQAGGQVLLTLSVRARDLGGAALLGRRRASESLDQYVAGQRTSEIRLRPETLAYDPSSDRTLRLSVPALGTRPVRPLTTDWPPALRESLRTAHIARVIEAPTTAAGLCWAALEALDVKTKKGPDQKTGIEKVARALSLQAARQQIVDLHQRTRTAVAAEVAAAHAAHHDAQAKADRLEAVARKATGDHAATVARKATAARAAELDQRTALEDAMKAEAHCAALDAWTGVGNDGSLRKPDRWLDAFAPPADAESALQSAAEALDALTDFLSGETAARLRHWRAMLAAPASLSTWIESTADRFVKSLDWLYVIRNTALHDGRFESSTDLLDVHAGRALVDLTLEFLGNWYQHEAKAVPGLVALPSIKVIEHLAARQEEVLGKLRGGTRDGWHVTRLTSATSTGWDRHLG
ncbi:MULTISPECIES: hypothetical protein [Streptomyces]|uniref:Uncharacterized protein n=1 Tax=Streptomyces flavovirens TaxID=52258 RepID=A0ABV8NF46_9ACTN|nr:hypothetical protein [Streptomyces sp. MBT51]MBK3593329.1 hypothetical protein [Streptomyces sp. MBT51]